MWEHLHTLRTTAQQLSVAGMKKERCITTEDWPQWTLGGSETNQKRMECDWSCFTLLLWVHWALDMSDKGWHPAGLSVNRHATHTQITPNNPLHCYLPFNSQLSVRSYSVAPHNPCVLFSLLWQAVSDSICSLFWLLTERPKIFPRPGDQSLLKCVWPTDESLSASGLLSPQPPVAITHQQGRTKRSRFPRNW